jgi:hypothetical protein
MQSHRNPCRGIVALFLALVIFSCEANEDSPSTPSDNLYPNKPIGLYPPDGSTGQSRSPFFSWACEDPEGDRLGFHIMLWEKGTDIYVFTVYTTEEFSFTYSDTLKADTEYEWEVDARDFIRGYNYTVGDTMTFMTGSGFNNPPVAPYDLIPSSDLYRQNKITFQWKCFDPEGGDLTFDLLLGSRLGSVMIQDLTETSYLYDAIEMDVAYTWKVVAHDAKGGSAESSPVTFTSISSYPPDVPSLPSPTDGAVDVPVDVTLSWTCTDPDGDPLIYDVRMALSGGSYTTISSGQADTFLTVTGLEYGTAYDWNIAAEDNYGLRTLGPHWTFTTVPLSDYAPASPHDPSPTDGERDVPVDVTLSWSCSDPNGDPLTYNVDMGFTGGTLLRISTDQPDTFLVITGLQYEKAYDWMVSAKDDGGLTTYGPIWNFATKKDPNQQEGVFAELTVLRSITYDGSIVSRNDRLIARFDSSYAPDGPIHPLQPAAVSCNAYDLVWLTNQYSYSDWQNPLFLNHNVDYEFVVTAGGGVPALTTSIQFPSCEMYITNPTPYGSISRSGFDLEWQYTTCSGSVDIFLIDTYGNPPYVSITTENDGSYTFTGAELAAIPPTLYELQIVLDMHNRETIVAAGYHPQSWIWARVLSTQLVTIF